MPNHRTFSGISWILHLRVYVSSVLSLHLEKRELVALLTVYFYVHIFWVHVLFGPRHDKTNKMSARPAKTDQPGHLSSLISVFAVRTKKPWVLSYPLSAQWRLWLDWADARADLSLRWAHTHFVGFVMSWLIYALLLTAGEGLWSLIVPLPRDLFIVV